MVVVGGKAKDLDEARLLLEKAINDGSALEAFRTFLENQDGDGSVVDDVNRLPQARFQIDLPSQKSGTVTEIIANEIGVASMMLGAGRQTKEDDIDLSVGIVLNKKVGDFVSEGESLLTIHSNCEQIDEVKAKLNQSITISSHGEIPTLIHKIITE